MLKKFLRRAAVLPIVVAALASTTATAQGMTISLGTPDLSARVLITVPVNVSCSPFDPSLTLAFEEVGVTVVQASGNAIADGGNLAFGSPPTLLFACDGSEQTVPVTVLANTAHRPFHGGPAVFSAFALANAGIPCGPGCFTDVVGQSSSVGPTTIVMH